MIIINNLAMAYGSKLLFEDVNLVLSGNNRYALVGANGTGKSTFLKLLAKEENPLEGTIQFAKDSRIGWLKQDQFRYEHELVLNVVLRGKQLLWQALEEKNKILKKPISAVNGYRLSELEEIIFQYDGYSAEAVAQKLLSGLGISEEQQYESLSALSGGYKLRVLLAQALFDNPDILVLDEPNNYLDIVTIAWLEDYLKNEFKGLLIFTSHDQYFLNNLATKVLDIDYGEIREYVGNYDAFVKQKQAIIEQKLHQRAYMEKKIARLRIFIERFRASPTRATQALAREKMIEKMELPDIEKSSRKSPHFQFLIERPSGKQVLKVSKISKKFNTVPVLKNISFEVNRAEKIVIIGQNGIGKSTLLKIIMGILQADGGSYEWGYETHVSFFAQEHHELAHEATTVFDWLCNHTHNVLAPEIRKTLGTLLFTQDDVFKKVLVLSGGEITRLIFAKIIFEKRNILILDEPTNHLDLESRNALADALNKYEGTVLIVSHDRHFVSQIATRIISITKEKITDFKGSYAEYLAYGFDHLNRKMT